MFQLVLNFKTLIITGIVALVLVGGLLTKTYYSGYTAGKEACELKHQKEYEKLKEDYEKQLDAERKKNEDLATKLDNKLVEVKTITKVITRNVLKEIEKPVYHDCIVPDSGLRIRNEAAAKYNSSRTGASDPTTSDSTVPTDSSVGHFETIDDGSIARGQLEPYGPV